MNTCSSQAFTPFTWGAAENDTSIHLWHRDAAYKPALPVHTDGAWMVWRVGASDPSHSKRLEISNKRASCERMNLFFGKEITYIHAHKGPKIGWKVRSWHTCFTNCRLAFPSPGLFSSTRRIGKNNPGLVNSMIKLHNWEVQKFNGQYGEKLDSVYVKL